jgi:hypothetical protein
MKKGKENSKTPLPDPHLDAPSEANREKHINFREVDEEDADLISFKNKEEVTKRREAWQKGLDEGRKAKENNSGAD